MPRPGDVPEDNRDPAQAGHRRRYQRGPHLFRRGEWWYVRVPGGTPPERALRTRDGAEADRLLREYLDGRRSPARLVPGLAADELSIPLIYARWIAAPHGWTRRTLGSYDVRAAAFVAAMNARGITLPSQLNADAIDAWIRDREGDVSRATINRDLLVARRMLAWAAHEDRRLCDVTPLARRRPLREPKRRPRHVLPDPEQVARVVDALRAQGEEGVALLIATAAATGLRLEELRRLTPAHVTDRAVRVEPETGAARDAWSTKGYATREIPLSPAALAVVRRFVEWRTTTKGGKGKALGLSDCWIRPRLEAACASARVPRFLMHDLRRSFVTEAVGAGIPIRVAGLWLGHKDVATTEGYVGGYATDASVVPPTPRAIRSATKTVAHKGQSKPQSKRRTK